MYVYNMSLFLVVCLIYRCQRGSSASCLQNKAGGLTTPRSSKPPFPDSADAWIVVEGRNLRLSGQAGRTSDIRHVTLRSVTPGITPASIQAIPCLDGVPVSSVTVANATFNRAQDCAPDVTGFQTTLTGIVPESVGGTVTVTVQVPGGSQVNLVTAAEGLQVLEHLGRGL